jgi:hypothetical protein
MPMQPNVALDQVKMVNKFRDAELVRLEKVHSYLRDLQAHPAVPPSSPKELVRLAEISRVPIMDIVVSAIAQAMYVDGYRAERSSEDAQPWGIWQANGLDARQIGVHRATLAYGASYVTVLPGTPVPVIRGYSPRKMTALYSEDDDEWPVVALRVDEVNNGYVYRLYDTTSVYIFDQKEQNSDIIYRNTQDHNVGVVPVVRFLNSIDEDEDNVGEVEPLYALQDQVNLTTFELLVAQHYGAFRQRYIIGWVAQSETELLKAGASRLWAMEDDPNQVQVGEFEQTVLDGYIASREASLRHAATLSQTPVHELMGTLINLSAEALVAAEKGHQRKVSERQVAMGEAWEQTLSLAGRLAGFEVDDGAQVRWRDTESRALAATVDALGKMAQMLGIPPQELWERVPNVSQQDIERWKAAAESGDAITQLNSMLDRQAAQLTEGEPAA